MIFSTLPYVCNFTNVAFCGHPQSEPVNSGWSDAPAGRWGGRIRYHITDELQIQGGVYDVNPRYTRRQDGFKLNFAGNTGAIAAIEIGYQLGKNPEDYGGTYKIGAYYDTSAAADLANPAVFDQGRQGLYLEAAQQIYKWGPDRRSGLALFGIFTVSDQNTAKFKHYYEAGAASREGKARMNAFGLPDPIPTHREPIYTPRVELVARYPTLPDARQFRLPNIGPGENCWRLSENRRLLSGRRRSVYLRFTREPTRLMFPKSLLKRKESCLV